jgi:hypothetical protein
MALVPPLSQRDIAIRQEALAGAQLNTARMQAVGGDQWTVSGRTDNGITEAADAVLGTLTGYALAPTEVGVVAGPGSTFVERERWTFHVATSVLAAFVVATGRAFEQGLLLQSVAVPSLRLRVLSVDVTDNPGYVRATLERV